jgi:hypothetical protein
LLKSLSNENVDVKKSPFLIGTVISTFRGSDPDPEHWSKIKFGAGTASLYGFSLTNTIRLLAVCDYTYKDVCAFAS